MSHPLPSSSAAQAPTGGGSHLAPVSAFTWRIAFTYMAVMGVLTYWTTYSECVVSATSFHSLSPPMNIIFALAILSGVLVPLHKRVIAGGRFARFLFFLLLVPAFFYAGDLLLRLAAFAYSQTGEKAVWRMSWVAAWGLAALLYLPLSRAAARSRPLSPAELIAVYAMMMVGTLLTSYGGTHFLLPTLTSARYFAKPETHWQELFLRYLPGWFGPTDKEVIRGFWEHSDYGVPWSAWVGPLAVWAIFIFGVLWVMLCLCSIVQRQWIDRERLTFPLVFLPLEIAREEDGHLVNSFFRSPWTWFGVLIPVVLHTINGLHSYYPAVPTLNFRHVDAVASLQTKPWNAIGWLDVTFYPCIVGIAYLLTLEISLSCWAFFLIRKLEPVLGSMAGWSDTVTPGGFTFPFADHQSTGAFIALVVSIAWVARKEWVPIVRQAVSGRQEGPGAMLSYRASVFGGVGGILFLAFWSQWAGMNFWVALLFFLILFIWCIALTRIRAEAGMGGITGPMTPQETMFAAAGTDVWGVQNLTVLSQFRWLTTDLRALPCVMPSAMENFKMAEVMRLKGRSLVVALLFASGFAMLVAYIAVLTVAYRFGGVSMNAQRFLEVPVQPFRDLASYITSPRQPDAFGIGAIIFGFVFTLLMSYMRLNYIWWPFHPIGYAVGFSRRTIEWMWFSIFLGWLLKVVITRVGGLRGYRRFLPFFLGMILGEFTMGVIFGMLGVLYPETAGYQLYP
ncbi:MAG: hypothetical protein IT210_08815 [Armatimonadetes bacterium]|nr:hypothetical protein [Armatimonadota bacterium]